MEDTKLGLPTMDQVMMDAAQAADEMTGQVYATHDVDRPPTDALTNQGEAMFHIDTGTMQYEDQDRLLWQRRLAFNWDTGI